MVDTIRVNVTPTAGASHHLSITIHYKPYPSFFYFRKRGGMLAKFPLGVTTHPNSPIPFFN
ncbi:MAG: hypothetical protein WAM88_08860 [Nitrososphaeraceae archaeon]